MSEQKCDFCGTAKIRLLISLVCPRGCVGPASVVVGGDQPPLEGPYRTAAKSEPPSKVVAPSTKVVAPSTKPKQTAVLTLANGTVVQLCDWIDTSLYSTVELTAPLLSRSSVNLFTYGRSQLLPGSSSTIAQEHHTNLPRTGDSGLPQDWEFLTYGCHAEIEHEAELEVRAWALRTTAIFRYNQKAYITQPLSQLSYQRPIRLTLPDDDELCTKAQAASSGSQDKLTAPRGVSFVIPIQLRMNLSYTMELRMDAVANANLRRYLTKREGFDQPLLVRVHLNGLLKRVIC